MSNCKRCGKPIVWPQPYVKGQPPLEPDGKTTHDCPAWNRDNNNTTQPQQQQQATVQVGYADISDLRATVKVTKDILQMILEETRNNTAKVERLLAAYTHAVVDPKAEAEEQMDKDKEDGIGGDYS